MMLIRGLGFGFKLCDTVPGGIGCGQRGGSHWSAHAQRRCSSRAGCFMRAGERT
jgi:hypothetical protein